MPRLTWSDRAIADVGRLARFLRPKSPRAAQGAVGAIRKGAKLLQRFPEVGRPVEDLDPTYRELPVNFGASGYFIYSRLDGDTVQILTVRHGRQAGYQWAPAAHP